MSKSTFLHNYNPDVLSCLANLSNDEVFTPPKLANEILDMLPKSIWHNKNAKFLDPCTKTGVFLREIVARLNKGLEKEIPDSQERINHICNNQVFGIAITELTASLSRRSVYCSRKANGDYSICTSFKDKSGNIRFDKTNHTWENGKCIFCGASQEVYDRDESLETYAYQFIHTKKPEEIFNMKFDVIVGNPPYQLSDGGAQKSATPIYNKFVETAIKLNPRYITMIIPARWYSGGKGLDDFREMLIKDRRMSILHDFPDTSECFSGLNIRGGVCYFLWDKTHSGDCIVYNHNPGKEIDSLKRPLLSDKEESVFIRFNKAIPILSKVRAFGEKKMDTMVSPRKPFGLPTNFIDFKNEKDDVNNILLYRFGNNGYVSIAQIPKNKELINKYKVLIPYSSTGGDEYPHLVLTKPILAGKGSICTETYLTITPIESEEIGENVMSYMRTRFFRFLLLLLKNSQHLTQKTYSLVPVQNFTESWTDEKLYAKYGITDDEIKYIESLIRPLDK